MTTSPTPTNPLSSPCPTLTNTPSRFASISSQHRSPDHLTVPMLSFTPHPPNRGDGREGKCQQNFPDGNFFTSEYRLLSASNLSASKGLPATMRREYIEGSVGN